MHSLGQAVLYCTKIARLPFGLQSYSFVENYILTFAKAYFSVHK